MESNDSSEVVHDFYPRFRVYKDGRVERFRRVNIVPPSDDPKTGVQSKDVVVSPETGLSARLFRPPIPNPGQKLPLLIYNHGGAFCLESAFSSVFHNYLNSLVAEANVIAVSVDYRLAPEHPIPACYEDSWAVTRWVFSHSNGGGPDPWLNRDADFDRVFLAGDSAGANIAHDTLIRAGSDGGMKILGAVLAHPFFGNDEPDKLWACICPDSSGVDDPRLNPAADPTRLSRVVCRMVMICVAEEDSLRERGVTYYEALRTSGWGGEAELVETEGEGHVFHLFNQESERAVTQLKRVASFLNRV
ncbi:hypothetical protein Nepgr_012833 [Nepenthes gracilis]|uniref:Alpha/beta hydrolase fold-3 domain-containing protein n=1 Tax=Nepenthes gracilis TaxID=150966 RepID=A0AAD3XN49_NEPGR|nr:hypothetical protein Nepgr_012833 [Nepenthes gracilis]